MARKVSLVRAVTYIVAQCLGAICGAGLAKTLMRHSYNRLGGGANFVAPGYSKGTALGAEIIGTFVLVYTVFSATDPKRNARDSHVPVSIIVADKITQLSFIGFISKKSYSLLVLVTAVWSFLKYELN